MVHDCCQCKNFVPDTAVKSQCVGHCKVYDAECSGYSDHAWSEFHGPRECPGFQEAV